MLEGVFVVIQDDYPPVRVVFLQGGAGRVEGGGRRHRKRGRVPPILAEREIKDQLPQFFLTYKF